MLHALRQSGVRAASIAADVSGYRGTPSERGAAEAGRSYDIVPMLAAEGGIFHPKLTVLDGPAGPRAAIGSGNLTFRGCGGNIEAAEYLSPAATPEAMADLAGFLDRLSSSVRAKKGLSCERDPVPAGLA